MKVEVGMYVRYNGQIMKITELGYNNETFMSNGNGWFSLYNCKASHNIIDLIEEGDYVNGKEVVSKHYHKKWYLTLDTISNKISDNEISEEDIKSILTKEQYERAVYRV